MPPLVLTALVLPITWTAVFLALRTGRSRYPGWTALGIGGVTAIAASILQTPIWGWFSSRNSWGGVVGKSVIVFALTEELARGAGIYLFVIRRQVDESRRNAMLSGAVIGLGFALIENLVRAFNRRIG